jgi:hypothetical protein
MWQTVLVVERKKETMKFTFEELDECLRKNGLPKNRKEAAFREYVKDCFCEPLGGKFETPEELVEQCREDWAAMAEEE